MLMLMILLFFVYYLLVVDGNLMDMIVSVGYGMWLWRTYSLELFVARWNVMGELYAMVKWVWVI